MKTRRPEVGIVAKSLRVFIIMNVEEIGALIRRRRKALGIKQADAAELAGVAVHTLSNIESGAANPTIEVLTKILGVLGLELNIEVAS